MIEVLGFRSFGAESQIAEIEAPMPFEVLGATRIVGPDPWRDAEHVG